MRTKLEKKQFENIDNDLISKKGELFLEKMVEIKSSNSPFHKNPQDYILMEMMEPLYDAIYFCRDKSEPDGEERYCNYDWTSIIYNIKDTLKNILVLLGRPDVNKHYPEYDNTASDKINNLIGFFEALYDSKIFLLAMDYFLIRQYPTNLPNNILLRAIRSHGFHEMDEESGFFDMPYSFRQRHLEEYSKKFKELGSPTFEKLLNDIQNAG